MKDIKQLGARLSNTGNAKAPVQVDAAAIRELAELLEQTGLAEIEIEQSGRRIRVARHHAAAATAQTPAVLPEAPMPAQRPDGRPGTRDGAVTSPMVGTVYVSPEPGRAAFVKVGDAVREGDTLLLVEAMKTMNPILAPRGATVQEICVQDAQPVEFGQVLVVLSERAS